MDNVIEMNHFKPKKLELVRECSCTSQHFYINADGTLECRSCGLIQERLEWVYRKDQPA